MVKLGRALIILPGGSPQSGEYVGACKALGLRQSPHGHAFYLVETLAGSLTLVSAELGEPTAIWDAPRSRAARSGSPNTGEQPDGTAMFRGLRTSTGAAEVVEIGLTGRPIARVIVNARSGKLEGVGVSNRKPETDTVAEPGVAKPAGRMEEAVREVVADVLAETLVGAIWPAFPSTGALTGYDSLYRAAEFLLEPEMLLLKLINASVRAAAHAAGFGILAPLIGQMAEDLCAEFLRPSPANQTAGDMVKTVDIYLYDESSQLAECPALRGLAIQTVADVIGKLLASGPGTQTAPHVALPPSLSFRTTATGPSRQRSRRGTRTAAPVGGSRLGDVRPVVTGQASLPADLDALVRRMLARGGAASKGQGTAQPRTQSQNLRRRGRGGP